MIDLSVRVGGLTLANPVMPASGPFAEGLDKAIDFNRLGAFVTKTITRELRAGNPLPRVVERPGGLINSIGIPSKGVPYFLEHTLPYYASYQPPLVVSIGADRGRLCAARSGADPARDFRNRGQHFMPEYRGRRQGIRDAGGLHRGRHPAVARRDAAPALGQAEIGRAHV